MAINEKLRDRVRDALGPVPLEEKKMFRGMAFMVRGKMCVTVSDDRIMCRIDPAAHGEAIGKPGCRTVIMKGREYQGFVYVDESALKTRKALDYWVGLALAFNDRAKASRKKPPREKAFRKKAPRKK
ncbi:MAG TPA: TfoX/Sxy family protein [Fibrobacteria bacterium]|nr:TfoX/Sxy family protein [Fibrobacteria bacterium]